MQFGTKTKLCGQSIKLLTFPSQKCRAVTKCPRIGDLCTSYDRNNSLNGNQCMSNCKRLQTIFAPHPYVRSEIHYKVQEFIEETINFGGSKNCGQHKAHYNPFLTSCVVSNSSFRCSFIQNQTLLPPN